MRHESVTGYRDQLWVYLINIFELKQTQKASLSPVSLTYAKRMWRRYKWLEITFSITLWWWWCSPSPDADQSARSTPWRMTIAVTSLLQGITPPGHAGLQTTLTTPTGESARFDGGCPAFMTLPDPARWKEVVTSTQLECVRQCTECPSASDLMQFTQRRSPLSGE